MFGFVTFTKQNIVNLFHRKSEHGIFVDVKITSGLCSDVKISGTSFLSIQQKLVMIHAKNMNIRVLQTVL